MEVRCKRIHEQALPEDGTRVLVDRLWPRGVRKADAQLDYWCRDVAPSVELRQWFGHDRARFDAFAEQYRAELAARPDAVERLRQLAASGVLTLVYGARDTEYNHARVLAAYLRAAESGQAGEGCPDGQ